MRSKNLLSKIKTATLVVAVALVGHSSYAQTTNVYDNVIATSPDHTYLATALAQEGLDTVLRDQMVSYTVFAPDNDAFDSLAVLLNTDINGLLQLPNLDDILVYHVLNSGAVPSNAVTNGAIVQPINLENTLKLTVTSMSKVYVNHSEVTGFDLTATNGVVHVLDQIVLPSETVVDIAIANGFTHLTDAVIKAELLPILTNPFADFTVFAPNNMAFDALATKLNTDINGLLNLPNLGDILAYHVLDFNVPAANVSNGAVVQPVSSTNTLKLTVTSASTPQVFANQAEIIGFDVNADNGVVHVLQDVVLPSETVVDIAIDNGFTHLTDAVIKAELLPILTNPFADLTVFAPNNAAFDALATTLNTDINGLLDLPNLGDILAYHVLDFNVPSANVSNGAVVQPVSTTNTLKLTVTSASTPQVYANQAEVIAFDINADNGVVHVLQDVVLPVETVVDVAIDNQFDNLTAAVIKAELLPALTNPFATLTVFAPNDLAFDALAAELNTDINGILALPNLGDILAYHVLGETVLAGDLVDGSVTALNNGELVISTSPSATVNGTDIILTDLTTANGVVHVVEDVLLQDVTGIGSYERLNINIYPNPVSDYMTVDLGNEVLNNLSIVDLNGKLIKSFALNNQKNNLDLTGIATGTYMLQFTGENKIDVRKIQIVSGN